MNGSGDFRVESYKTQHHEHGTVNYSLLLPIQEPEGAQLPDRKAAQGSTMHQLGSSLPWDVAGEKIKTIKHLREGLGVTKLSGPEAASFSELWSDPVLTKAVAVKH